jgi:hypothetical protein
MPMRNIAFQFVCATGFALTALTGMPPTLALAHEGHQMECNQESMNAMTADAQAMTEGDAKMTVTKEMKLAEERMRKKDVKGCVAHMRNAMEAMEK